VIPLRKALVEEEETLNRLRAFDEEYDGIPYLSFDLQSVANQWNTPTRPTLPLID
jgi:hypothetical protein